MSHSLLLTVLLLVAIACEAAPYKQIFSGYNGPEDSQTSYFSDAESVKTSWLATVLSNEELESILAQVDFKTHLLAVSAVGARKAVTNVSVEGVSWTRTSASITVFVGVADTTCIGPRPNSYPFVVAVIERPAEYDGLSSYYHQNFPDQCGPVHEGKPSGAPPNNSFKPTPHRGVGHVPALR